MRLKKILIQELTQRGQRHVLCEILARGKRPAGFVAVPFRHDRPPLHATQVVEHLYGKIGLGDVYHINVRSSGKCHVLKWCS